MNDITFKNIFTTFTPHIITIDGLDHLPRNNLILYGEIHGAIENAHIIYTLCSKLNIRCLAVEYSSIIDDFITLAVTGKINFSMIDTTMFDSSVLSIEMLKTIVELLKFGVIQQIKYLDNTFSYTDEQLQNFNPEDREKHIADNILALDKTLPTLCVMGNWHTRPRKIGNHVSALMHVRQSASNTTSIYNKYRKGSIRNIGNIVQLPTHNTLSDHYSILQKTKNNFDLIVPEAHPIEI